LNSHVKGCREGGMTPSEACVTVDKAFVASKNKR
jgi:hypothetical protein